MSNEQMAQSILQFAGGKENIRMVSNCMTRVRLEVNDPAAVQIDRIKALEGVFGVHVDAQVQVIVGPACRSWWAAHTKLPGRPTKKPPRRLPPETSRSSRAARKCPKASSF